MKKEKIVDFYFTHMFEWLVKNNLHLIKNENYLEIKKDPKNEIKNKNDLTDKINELTIKDIKNLKWPEKMAFNYFWFLWNKAIPQEKKLMSEKLKSLLNHYSYNLEIKSIPIKLSNLKDKEGLEIYLNNVLPSVSLCYTKEHVSDIIAVVYKTFEDENKADLIAASYLNKRASYINSSESDKAEIKEFLVNFYNEDKLSLYKDAFPAIKAYLEAENNQDIFYIKQENEVILMIDFEKINGVLNFFTWTKKDYNTWITIVLGVIKEKDKRVKESYANDIKTKRGHFYKQIMIKSDPKNPVYEIEVKDMINSFFKCFSDDLNKNYYKTEEKKEFARKWFQSYKLKIELDKKPLEEKSIKKQKI